MPPWLLDLRNETVALLRAVPAEVRRRRSLWSGLALAGGVGVGLLLPGDVARSQAWFVPQDPALRSFCGATGYWAELHRVPLLVVAALWLAGWWRGRLLWRRAALAALLAGAGAGLFSSVVKGLGGRPRPMLTLTVDGVAPVTVDRFTGPSAKHDYQSFPSGHATHCMGVAAALAVAVPPVGVPAVVAAGGVAWTRMYFHRHYLGDVTGGALLGGLVGVWFGLAARRVKKEG